MGRFRVIWPVIFAGCASSRPPLPSPPPPAPAVAGVGWMAARWEREDGRGIEHWTPAGDALVGVAFTAASGRTRGFEVLFIHEVEGRLSLSAMPGGAAPVGFPATETAADAVTFENPAHDFPQKIRYARDGAALTAVVSGPGADDEVYRFTRRDAPRAPELEERDRALAAAVAERGADAFVDALDEDGALITPSGARAAGPTAVREALAPLMAGRPTWEPFASGLSPAEDAGYTIGHSTVWRGAHVTIWKKDDSGRWRVAFQAGDPVGK
jgi:ketosteroid isomerase-like protein